MLLRGPQKLLTMLISLTCLYHPKKFQLVYTASAQVPFGSCSDHRMLAGYVVLLFLYLTLNSVLNLTNKWALTWFSFPLLLTACHMAFSFLFLLPMMLREPMRSK